MSTIEIDEHDDAGDQKQGTLHRPDSHGGRSIPPSTCRCPARRKIVSVRIAPASSTPTCKPTVVITGYHGIAQRVYADMMRKLREALGACGAHVIFAESTSSMADRVCRAITASGIVRKNDGRQDQMCSRAERKAPSCPDKRLSISMKPVTGSERNKAAKCAPIPVSIAQDAGRTG